MSEPKIYKRNSKPVILGLVLYVVLVIPLTLFCLLELLPKIQGLWRFQLAINVILIALNILVLVVLALRLFNKKPSLILDDEGIEDNSSPFSPGKILWNEIADLREVSNKLGGKFIALDLKEPEKIRSRGKMNSMVYDNYKKTFGTPSLLFMSQVKGDFSEVFQIIKDRIKN